MAGKSSMSSCDVFSVAGVIVQFGWLGVTVVAIQAFRTYQQQAQFTRILVEVSKAASRACEVYMEYEKERLRFSNKSRRRPATRAASAADSARHPGAARR